MSNGRILFIRASAFGDVLLVNPFVAGAASPALPVDLYTLHDGVHWPGEGRVISMKTRSLRSVLGEGYERVHWFSYEHSRNLHILDGYELTSGLGATDRVPRWQLRPGEAAWRDRLLGALPRPLVGFHPASPLAEKVLPPETCRQVVRGVREAFGGTVVVTGETPLGLEGCLDLSGRTRSLRELAALVSGLDALVTIDSGPFHIGQALGLPMVGLFGCTLPELIATRAEGLQVVLRTDLECLGCYHQVPAGQEALRGCRRGDRACMEGMEPRAILAALKRAFDGARDPILVDRIRAYEDQRSRLMAAHAAGGASYALDYRGRMADLDRKLGGFKRFRRYVRSLLWGA